MIGFDTDEIIKYFFQSLLQKFRFKDIGLEQVSMKNSYFVVDGIYGLKYGFNKTSPNRSGSHIDSTKFARKQKSHNKSKL